MGIFKKPDGDTITLRGVTYNLVFNLNVVEAVSFFRLNCSYTLQTGESDQKSNSLLSAIQTVRLKA